MSNPIQISREILAEKGSGALLAGRPHIIKGVVPRLVRVGIGNLIFFTTYTTTVQYLTNRSTV